MEQYKINHTTMKQANDDPHLLVAKMFLIVLRTARYKGVLFSSCQICRLRSMTFSEIFQRRVMP